MRILHVAHHFHPCVGGMETAVRELCGQLASRGHTSDVLCLNRCADGPTLPAREMVGSARVFRVPYVDLKYYKVAPRFLGLLKGYDVVHVHGLGYFLDVLAATRQLHRKRLVLSTHGAYFHTGSLRRLKRAHFSTLARLSLRAVDRVVAVSRQDAELFSFLGRRVDCIPHGIDTARFASRRQKNQNSFIFVGRLARNKRVDNLLRAFSVVSRKSPRSRLLIMGIDSDHLLPSLRALARALGLEKAVAFAGNLPEEQKIAALGRSRFFVSASEYEGFGISALEAMAAGCIPILNRIPPFESLANGAGILADFSRPEEAGDAMLRSLRSPAALGQRARREARNYDWRHIMPRWEAVYG